MLLCPGFSGIFTPVERTGEHFPLLIALSFEVGQTGTINMATMIPDYEIHQVFSEHLSHAETAVYSALKNQLPSTTTVLYSVPWVARNSNGDIRDGETDFVVIDPDRGIAIIEVKGGSIEVSAGGLWSTRGDGGEIVPITNPFRQGVISKNVIKKEIGTIPGVNIDKIVFAHGVALPDVFGSAGHLGTDAPSEIVLTGDNLSSVSGYVSQIFDFWESGESMPFGQDQVDLIVEKNFPRQILAPSLGAEVRDSEQGILDLTDQQRRILGTLRSLKRACIEGAAGTGKTVIALEKALHLASENVETLLVCFNKLLAERLSVRAETVPLLTVLTFHDLCIRMAKRAGLDMKRDRSVKRNKYYDNVLPDLLLTSIENLPERPFDAVIVDEGQDLDPEWWYHLESLLKSEEHGWFWIFRDTAQNLYGREPALPTDMSTYSLDQNVRNTKNIHDAAAPFALGDPGYSTGLEGPLVRYELATTKSAVKTVVGRVLHELIADGGLTREEIIILTGSSVRNSSLSVPGKVGAFDLKPYGSKGTAIEVDSIWRFKGLERSVVIITDLAPDADNPLRYVGMTRARSVLVMIGPQIQ
jgi:hypothetical protein